MLHAVGHADLGVPPPDSASATDLLRLLDERPDHNDQTRRILRLRTPARTAGDTAPLAAALAALHADPGTDRACVVWGSGSTQTVLGALDAVITSGLRWSLIRIEPTVAPGHAVYDPTAGLPIDPVVPLLRRWRYHDLLRALVDAGQLSLTAEQRRVVDAEADHFGRAYVAPNADRMRAVMAAALMRGDDSSGFAVRAYVAQRYHELRAADGSPLDLLTEAAGPGRPPNSDVYQMLAYCTTYGLTRGHLVYAAGGPTSGSYQVTGAGIRVEVHPVDLSAPLAEIRQRIHVLGAAVAEPAG
ncbi:hypothetical protein [Micromonospora sp. LOL_023]|uniref:hypothetical protein n=1 Tax=Micromonospora sp. LOL_023 TaxID=3345418 RepID=UPI003A8B4C45